MKKEFRLLPVYQYIYVIITLAPSLFLAVYLLTHLYFDFFGICLLLPITLFMFAAILNSLQSVLTHPYRRIIISEDGIEYTRQYISFKARWDSLNKISRRWTLLGRLEGMLVDVTKIEFSEGANGELLTLFRTAFIPLSCFAKNWRNSELGQQIKQYAPHLFQ